MKYLDFFNSLNDLIKNINRSMGTQMMVKTLELFLYGLLLIFSGSVSPVSNLPLFIFTAIYVHLIIFQISYIASSTKEEVLNILF
jgi:hypothetical protein